MPTIHKFNSMAFKESFVLPYLKGVLKAAPGLMDRKNSIYRQNGDGYSYAFNFGAVAFWNVEPQDQAADVHMIAETTKTEMSKDTPHEDFIVEEDPDCRPRVEFSKLVIDQLTPERAELVAFTVAQSAAMNYYENLVDKMWFDVNEQVNLFRKKSRVSYSPRRLYKNVGEVLSFRNAVISVLHMLDRPDLIWEDKIMDQLYGDLRSIFDLNERMLSMQHKLSTIQGTLELLIDTSRDARLFIVEVAILALIALEIVLLLF